MHEIGHKLKLGIIGSSHGNGHPYSWSSIINGFNMALLEKCPYRVIIDYLKNQKIKQFPYAEITHIWTQNYNESQLISSITNIPNILDNFEDMTDIDGVLIARDDYENHYRFCNFFLKKKIPIYIDKPISVKVKDAEEIFKLEKWKGQIFTCSALKYAREIRLSDLEMKKIGKIKKIICVTPKSWERYSIHIIEPINELISETCRISKSFLNKESDKTTCSIEWDNGLLTEFTSTGEDSSNISFKYVGELSEVNKVFNNPYDCFKRALIRFCFSIQKKKRMFNIDKLYRVLKIIELGIKE